MSTSLDIRKIFSGFDSAWSSKNKGAITSIIELKDALIWHEPVIVSFSEALSHLQRLESPDCYHLLAIDQPIIVKNENGNRPVEKAISSLVGSFGGGVQPANRKREDLFGDSAPIWNFLHNFHANMSPSSSIRNNTGRFVIEVFPALGNLGLFPNYYTIDRRMPKYNPERKTFIIQDWQNLCSAVSESMSLIGLDEASEFCDKMAHLSKPSKTDQDKLDSVICALHAIHWHRHGFDRNIMVGDEESGYMIVPCHDNMAQRMGLDARLKGVPSKSSEHLVQYSPMDIIHLTGRDMDLKQNEGQENLSHLIMAPIPFCAVCGSKTNNDGKTICQNCEQRTSHP